MAIITYRNGIMASDSGGSSFDEMLEEMITGVETFKGEFRKILKTTAGSLIGCVGNRENCEDFLNWPELDGDNMWNQADEKFRAIIVKSDSKFYKITGPKIGIQTWRELDDFVAIGSGADIAIGAMYKNATAEEAVEIAIKYNDDCNGITNIIQNNALVAIIKKH